MSYHFHSGTQVDRAVTVWNVAGSMAERKESSRGFLTSVTSWPQPAVLAHPTCVRQMGMGPGNAVKFYPGPKAGRTGMLVKNT